MSPITRHYLNAPQSNAIPDGDRPSILPSGTDMKLGIASQMRLKMQHELNRRYFFFFCDSHSFWRWLRTRHLHSGMIHLRPA